MLCGIGHPIKNNEGIPMNLHRYSSLARCFSCVILMLLVGGLISCAPTPPAPVAASLSALRVVVDDNYPPYTFRDEQGNLQGILIDQWKLWEERTGVKVDLTALPWGEALERMKAGEFDVIDTIFYTDERAQIFDFTASYAQIDVPIFFQNNISGIADVGDLKGFRVAVKSGDANADYLISQGITDLAYYNNYEEIIRAAANGEEAIFVVDQPPALYFLYKYGIQDRFNHSAPLYSGEFHRAVQKGNAAVLNLVNAGFSAISPAEYQAIDRRWLGTGENQSLQQFIPYVVLGAVVVLVVVLVLIALNRALQQRVRQHTHELEETAEALHESRRFLADLIEYGGALIFVKDLEGRYELINRKWEAVTGLTRADVIGHTDEVLFPGPIGQQFRANDREVIESGNVVEREEFLEDASGRRSFISIKFPVRGEDGHVKGVCGMTTEITERKRAESQREAALEALAESEEIFRLFMEHSPIYVFFKDEQTRSLRLSKNYEQMLGWPVSELLGKTMDELFPSDLAKSMIADDLRILNEGRQVDVVEELNGRVYKTTKFPINRPGLPSWLAGFTIDITEQTRAIEALRQSEDKFSKAFHTSPDSSININRLSDGLYLEVNEGFTAMTGYTSEDVRGKTSLELNIWANPDDRTRLMQGLRERGEVSNLEASFRMKDGRLRTGLISARIIEVAGEQCILSITRDITDRKQAEEEIASLSRFPSENPNPVLRLNRDGDILYTNEASQVLLQAWARTTGDVALDYWRRLAIDTLAGGTNRSIDVECDRRVFSFSVVPILEGGYVNLYGGDITERIQMEEALRASEERYQTFILQSFEGISRTEFDHPIDITLPVETQIDLIYENAYMAECNQALAEMYHLPSAEALIGARLIEAHGGKDNPVNRAAFRKLIENGYKSTGDETVEYRADGEPVWFLSNTVGTVENGYLVRLWGTALDITERKRADAALQASEQKMRAIVDAAPFGAHLYELEPDGRLVFIGANHSADQILHLDHQQFIGKTIEEAFPPLIETEVPTAYRRVAATGERYQLDQIAYDNSGISGAFELHAFQTGPKQMAVFFRDVTERKQMEEALRVSLEKYRVLFESFPLGISITDSAGKILESNFQAERLLGVPKQKHERRTYDAPEWKFVRADGTSMPVEEYAAARALRDNQLVQNVEMGFVKDHGVVTWLSVTAAPIPLKGYGVAIAYGDITRSKEIEDEIRRLNEDLERRVIDRTQELAAANARLTELDQLKSKFVSDVSHELRTPIANLKLYIDLLERGKPEKQSHYVTVLQQQVRRVAALVDDILDLSRLERRKEQGVSYQAVKLNDVVSQVVLAHQPRAEADGLQLTFELAPDLPPIYGDANQLAQVVTNLVANALSYTAAGYVRASTTAHGKRVCLSVADSGSGIPTEDLPHVFERFYRGHLVQKNDIPGTGLGLAIVKEIVDLHQGQIEIDSQPGRGTTFRVWLPTV
jgi:PAS domain S-box-containing protein